MTVTTMERLRNLLKRWRLSSDVGFNRRERFLYMLRRYHEPFPSEPETKTLSIIGPYPAPRTPIEINLPELNPTFKEPDAYPNLSLPNFPLEILDLIWSYAIIDTPARTIPIQLTPSPSAWSGSSIILTRPSVPIPAVLHVCARSRFLAMKRWKFFFGGPGVSFEGFEWSHELRTGPDEPQIWVDIDSDTLHFLAAPGEFSPLRDWGQGPEKERRLKGEWEWRQVVSWQFANDMSAKIKGFFEQEQSGVRLVFMKEEIYSW